MTSDELRIAGDRAFDTGTWTHAAQAEGRPVQQSSGKYLVIWQRGRDGRWRIEYDMWHRPTAP
jgi:ketosteroid isomerase-like protein